MVDETFVPKDASPVNPKPRVEPGPFRPGRAVRGTLNVERRVIKLILSTIRTASKSFGIESRGRKSQSTSTDG